MMNLNETIIFRLTERYATLAEMVRDLSDPLTEAQFWTKPFSFGNSFGHLVLHVTGNLNYYIGAKLAATGYVRDRPREFSETVRPSKAEVLRRFDEAIDMALRTIRSQAEQDWSASYSAAGADAQDRFGIVLACATHLHHHVGQMMYLGFALQRKG